MDWSMSYFIFSYLLLTVGEHTGKYEHGIKMDTYSGQSYYI